MTQRRQLGTRDLTCPITVAQHHCHYLLLPTIPPPLIMTAQISVQPHTRQLSSSHLGVDTPKEVVTTSPLPSPPSDGRDGTSSRGSEGPPPLTWLTRPSKREKRSDQGRGGLVEKRQK